LADLSASNPLIPAAAGETGALIAARDWSRSPLGPIESWPQSLRTALGLILLSPVPMVLLWGTDGIMLYNDAYSAFAGGRHPELLGSKVREGWPEVADFNDNVMKVGLAGGTLAYKDQEMVLHRHGRPEQVWMNLDYSPVLDESGRPAGVIAIVVDVTGRNRAEATLREGEARFRTMADSAPVMIWVTDADGVCIYLNRRWYEYTGQAKGEGEGYGWLDAVHPDDRAAAEQTFVAANAERRNYRVDFRLRRADGVYRWTIDAAAPRFGEDGAYLGYVGSVIDIDERREAEARLAFSEEQLRLAIESAEVGLWDLDLVTDTLFWPPRVKAMFGISPDVPITMDDFFAGLHPEDRERTVAAFASATDPERRALYDVEYRTVGKEDGAVRWVAAKGRGIFDAAGRCVRVIGTAIDISARKEIEQTLRDLNDTLEQRVQERTAERNRVWSMSRDLLAVMGFDGYLKAINPAWEATLGFDERTLLERPFPQQVHPDDHEAVAAVVERLRQGETIERFEDRLRHADGSWRWIAWALVPAGGEFYAVGRDVTREKDAAAELERAQDALRQAQKMEAVGQLTGGIAHDFNNLLGAVVGNLDLIRRRPAEPEKVRRWAENGMAAAERGTKLTGQLLAFSRAQRIELKPVSVSALVEDMRDMLARTLGPMVPLSLELGGDGAVLSDPTQLEMAILNLAINARDAMSEGGALTISTAVRRIVGDAELGSGDYVELAVADTGAGMPPDVVARAFDPFFTTKGVGKGTGLGLSQVYGIARQTGGTVRIDSRVGAGTTVRIFLPRTDARISPEPEGEEEGALGKGATATILVVDDDADMRRVLVESLDALGYRVIEAHDGASGLKLLAAHAPDLLMVDFAMPGMNGAEVAKAARERRPHLPVVFASGYADTAAIGEVGGPDVVMLRKPFRVDQLHAAITDALDGRSLIPSGQ
jgi:PAS domain S-box-containing protein